MSKEIKTTNNNDDSKKTIVTVVYVLQAVSLFLGVTFLIAAIINYVKKSDVADTWLESHFRWQIRTFWFTLLWSFIGIIGIDFIIGIPILLASSIWIVYRIIKGWLRLNDKKEMYVYKSVFVSNFKDSVIQVIGGAGALVFYFVFMISYLHGIYLAFHEGFLSFVLVMLIPPWAIIKGAIGFF